MAKKKKVAWFTTGKEGIKKSKALDKQAAEDRKRRQEEQGPMRFWIDNDSAAKITFN